MAGLFIISVLFGLLIAHFLGRKRQIGFGWSFFFCLFLNPIIGFIITMLSRKYYDDDPAPSQAKKVIGGIVIAFFSLSALGTLFAASAGEASEAAIQAMFMAIGFIGLGYYLIELGKGKNFNSEVLTTVNE